MAAFSGHNLGHVASHTAARQRRLARIARRYGVVTVARLREEAHAECWEIPFDTVLRRATRAGRLRKLSPDLYEAGDE
jgi:hypothetical protein